MSFFTAITFDQVALSFMACFLVREAMIATLPNYVAGPGGWLINTTV
ncbi:MULTISPECIES: hypothetical protein [Falsihalocynthiibacter]